MGGVADLRRDLAAAARRMTKEVGRPVGLRRRLAATRGAQLMFGLLVVLGLTFVPPVCHTLAEAVFPPQEQRDGFYGLKRSLRTAPEARTLKTALMVLYWLGAGAATAGLLLLPFSRNRRRASVGTGTNTQRTPTQTPDQTIRERWADDTPCCPEAATATALDHHHDTLLSTDESTATVVNQPNATETPHARNEEEADTMAQAQLDGIACGASLREQVEPKASSSPSDQLSHVPGGRYELQQVLARGATGVVYRGRDKELNRLVAVKELSPDWADHPSMAARFEREAQVLANLTHPNIVQLFDLIHEEGRMWMAMELIEGGSLAELLTSRGPLPMEEVVRLGALLARALDAAHQQDVVHRDFKPGNVLLTYGGVPKITDFGLAKVAEKGAKLTQTGVILGSPVYMSPEQIACSDVDRRTDIYALGVTLYELLTGRAPFEGSTMDVLNQHLTTPPPPPSFFMGKLPPAFDKLIMAMLAKDPQERTPDMETVARALDGIERSDTLEILPPLKPPRRPVPG
jgi:tRNA A-37 threonylcarbamoyl transferase component Bud32